MFCQCGYGEDARESERKDYVAINIWVGCACLFVYLNVIYLKKMSVTQTTQHQTTV
jgi:hypothetical protein